MVSAKGKWVSETMSVSIADNGVDELHVSALRGERDRLLAFAFCGSDFLVELDASLNVSFVRGMMAIFTGRLGGRRENGGGPVDPDWAEGGAKPGQKSGVADPDWAEDEAKPKTDDEFLEPDWARDDGGEEKEETAAGQGLPDPDWAVEEEPPEEPEGSEAEAEDSETSQSETDPSRKA